MAEDNAVKMLDGFGKCDDRKGVFERGRHCGKAIGFAFQPAHAGVVSGDVVGGVGRGDVVEFEVEAVRDCDFDAKFIFAVDREDGFNAAALGRAEEHGGFGVAEGKDDGMSLHQAAPY